MFNFTHKIFFVFALNLILSVPVFAKVVEQKKMDFQVKADELPQNEVHYFFTILSPRKLAVQYPEIFELDSLSLIQESDVEMVVSKSVHIVNKPAGFFDDKQLSDERFINHLFKGQKVKRLNPDSFKVTVPGKDGYSYVLKNFFDSDDVSTLPNSKIIRGVQAARNLDVISKSASTIMFSERTKFTKYLEGGVSVSSFIPVNERKTLVITYNLWAVKKPVSHPESLKTDFLSEIETVKTLIESYKP